MSKILKTGLARNESNKSATSSYIDDILVDESKVSFDAVIEHFKKVCVNYKRPRAIDWWCSIGIEVDDQRQQFMV